MNEVTRVRLPNKLMIAYQKEGKGYPAIVIVAGQSGGKHMYKEAQIQIQMFLKKCGCLSTFTWADIFVYGVNQAVFSPAKAKRSGLS